MTGMNAQTGKALTGVAHAKQSVTDILTTPIGSRVMRRAYGSNLFELIDKPTNAATIAAIVAASAEAIKKWEKRIKVNKVLVISAAIGSVIINVEGIYLPTGEQMVLEGIEVKGIEVTV